jgi:hypothetical protein
VSFKSKCYKPRVRLSDSYFLFNFRKMPRGKNYVNNNRGLSMQRHKKETKMLQCSYGAGCTRPDCKYVHPTKQEAEQKKSNEPCMRFLAGDCTFTAYGCNKRHPPKAEAELLVAKYRGILCRFGDSCKTGGCLYVHPEEEGYDRLLAQTKQPAVQLGLNAQMFPPLMANQGISAYAISSPPLHSAWKPSPPTGETRNLVLQQPQRHGAAPLQTTSRYPPSAINSLPRSPPLPASPSFRDDYNANNSLSIHAKEFTPGKSFS